MYYLYKAGMLACTLFLTMHASDQPTPDSHSALDSGPASDLRPASRLSLESDSRQSASQDATPAANGIVNDIAKGSLLGFAEVLFPGQVLSYWMNRAIDGKPFRITQLYRGFWPNALGEMPITVIQEVTRSQATRALRAYQHADPNDAQKLGISFLAGVLGAVVETPSNAVQLYQQDRLGASRSMTYALWQLGKGAWRGHVPNAFLKEGPWAVGYQVLGPRGKQIAQDNFGEGALPAIAGTTAAGVATAVVTQPGAVLRNTMQATLLDQGSRHLTMRQTAADIYAKKGMRGFFVGGVRRGLRVTIALQLYVLYGELFEQWLRKE